MTKMYPNSANANIVPFYEPRRLNNSGFDDETTTVLMMWKKSVLLNYNGFTVFNPKNPYWFNSDRFVLSAGHGCMLQRNSRCSRRCFYRAVKMFEVTDVVSIIVALAATSINKAPAVGASGAVFGLVGSLAVFVMRHRVHKLTTVYITPQSILSQLLWFNKFLESKGDTIQKLGVSRVTSFLQDCRRSQMNLLLF
ncbi:hypothetical protein EV1_022347 [Malus domestica]